MPLDSVIKRIRLNLITSGVSYSPNSLVIYDSTSLSLWQPFILGSSLGKATKSIQESRWLLNNFPSSSGLSLNTKKFTNAKLSVLYPNDLDKSKKSYSALVNRSLKPQVTGGFIESKLGLGGYSLFEESRFFCDIRNYLFVNTKRSFTTLHTFIAGLSQDTVYQIDLVSPNTNYIPLLLEPYVPAGLVCTGSTPYSLITNKIVQTGNYKQNFTKLYFFDKNDMYFIKLLNSTSISSGTPNADLAHTISFSPNNLGVLRPHRRC